MVPVSLAQYMYMVYGLWSMVHGLWSVINGLWSMVYILMVNGQWSIYSWSMVYILMVCGQWSMVYILMELVSFAQCMYMVYGLWSMVYGLWSVVCGQWSMVFILMVLVSLAQCIYMVYGLWSMVNGQWSMVCGLWSMVYGLYINGPGEPCSVSYLGHGRIMCEQAIFWARSSLIKRRRKRNDLHDLQNALGHCRGVLCDQPTIPRP
jgi:hypothetical protein